MKTETKNYTVSIFGEQYHLVSDESQEHIIEAASLLDRMIKELASQAPRSEKYKLAILAALQSTSAMMKAQQKSEKREKCEQELVARTEQLLSSL